MKVLLDEGVSKRIRPVFERKLCCEVHAVRHQGWNGLRDDELLQQAALFDFTAIVTTDLRMADQQRQTAIAIISVDDNRIPALIAASESIVDAIRSTNPGDHTLVRIGSRSRGGN